MSLFIIFYDSDFRQDDVDEVDKISLRLLRRILFADESQLVLILSFHGKIEKSYCEPSHLRVVAVNEILCQDAHICKLLDKPCASCDAFVHVAFQDS